MIEPHLTNDSRSYNTNWHDPFSFPPQKFTVADSNLSLDLRLSEPLTILDLQVVDEFGQAIPRFRVEMASG